MTGNETDARRALNNEFSPIGDGSARHVYLNETVVYKVDRSDEVGANAREFRKATNLKSKVMPAGIRIPNVSMYVIDGIDVIAMDYIPGEALGACWCLPSEPHYHCLPTDIADIVSQYQYDIGGLNVVRHETTGEYYIIDFD